VARRSLDSKPLRAASGFRFTVERSHGAGSAWAKDSRPAAESAKRLFQSRFAEALEGGLVTYTTSDRPMELFAPKLRGSPACHWRLFSNWWGAGR